MFYYRYGAIFYRFCLLFFRGLDIATNEGTMLFMLHLKFISYFDVTGIFGQTVSLFKNRLTILRILCEQSILSLAKTITEKLRWCIKDQIKGSQEIRPKWSEGVRTILSVAIFSRLSFSNGGMVNSPTFYICAYFKLTFFGALNKMWSGLQGENWVVFGMVYLF